MKPIDIGTFAAKTHLSELLEKVQRGQSFYITKRGKRVAVIQPVEAVLSQDHDPEAILKLCRAVRAASRPGPESFKDLINEGRRR